MSFVPPIVSGAITQTATMVTSAQGVDLAVFAALTYAFHKMGCGGGSGLAGFLGYLIWKVREIITWLATATKEQKDRFKEAGKALLDAVGLSFLKPLIDAASDALDMGFDALLSPLVQSALLAIVGAWLILSLLKR
tara:strand:+ start:115 stop:522 length:408 start_codon:yes stop_codon:yes gene_type:complete